MSDRGEMSVTVFDQEQYDGEWPPENFLEAQAWFAEKLASIPVEYRDSATVEFDSVGSYEDSHYARIHIEYTRPETDAEMAFRLARIEAVNASKEAMERAQFESLKAKFGTTP